MSRLATSTAAIILALCCAMSCTGPFNSGATATRPAGRPAIAVMPRSEIAERLLASISKETGARAFGVFADAPEALAAARVAGIERLLAITVTRYDPRDPARLHVSFEIVEPDAVGISADELLAYGRNYGAEESAFRREARTLEVIASGDGLARFAARSGLGREPVDLLEAEIMLRDPARFLEFAAGEIAAAIER